MNNSGSGLLIAILAVLLLLLVAGAALFVVPDSPAAPGKAVARPAITMSVACVRTPAGFNATVTVANTGAEDVKNLRITQVTCGSWNTTATFPISIPRIPRNGSATFAVPFVGSVPADTSSVSVTVDYRYQFGWFGNGGGSSGVTSVLR